MSYSRRSLVTAVGVSALGGCLGSIDGTSDSDASSPSKTEVSLLLNWKPSGLHVPYFAAKAKGYYSDEGLTLSKIESGQGSDFSAKQVALGKKSFGVTSSDQVVTTAARGLSPLSVGIVMQRTPVVVFSVRENFGSKLANVDQLKGAKIGTGPGMVRILTKSFLEKHGVLDSVTMVDTGYDTVQQLLAGKIDAAGGVFGDVVDTRQHGDTIDRISVANTIPSYGHVVATESKFANDHPKTVTAFLRATARGAVWASNDPKGAIDELIDAVPALSESRDVEREKWEVMSSRYMRSDTVREHGWGWSESTPWQETRDALDGAGIIDEKVDTSSTWTNEHLDPDYQYIGSYAKKTG